MKKQILMLAVAMTTLTIAANAQEKKAEPKAKKTATVAAKDTKATATAKAPTAKETKTTKAAETKKATK